MQVTVDAVKAHVTGTDDAHDGVEVRAVVVAQAAASWTIFVISRMFLSKMPTVFGFVSISPAVSGPTAARSASRSTQPSAPDGMLMT